MKRLLVLSGLLAILLTGCGEDMSSHWTIREKKETIQRLKTMEDTLNRIEGQLEQR